MFPPIRPRPTIPSCITLPPSASDVLQSDSRDAAAALFEGRIVACRLRAYQPAEAELSPRDRQLGTGVVDHLEKHPCRRAALVQLSRRMEIARPVPVRHHAAGAARALD